MRDGAGSAETAGGAAQGRGGFWDNADRFWPDGGDGAGNCGRRAGFDLRADGFVAGDREGEIARCAAAEGQGGFIVGTGVDRRDLRWRGVDIRGVYFADAISAS